MEEQKTSTYFKIIESLCFTVGNAIATDKPVSIQELEKMLCDSGTKLQIISEEQYKHICSS